jgi:Tetracyclin repressor-like, C-terminal domain
VAPGTRVTLALLSIVRDARNGGRLAQPAHALATPSQLADDLDRLAAIVELDVPPTTLVAVLAAWSQLFGLLSFELSNQTRGVVEDDAALLAATARLGALSIGLSDRSTAT